LFHELVVNAEDQKYWRPLSKNNDTCSLPKSLSINEVAIEQFGPGPTSLVEVNIEEGTPLKKLQEVLD
jgi:hypothetical protein